MCLPVALAAAGGLMGAASSVAQGNAQAKAYEAQAKIAQQNARLAELQGVRELEKGAREEARFKQQQRQFQGTQRAQLAASGMQMSGSALSVLADTASGIEQDAAMLRFNTLQDKYARDVQAVNFRNEASAMSANAKNARTAGYIGGAASLIGTGLTIAGMTAKAPLGVDFGKNAIKVPNIVKRTAALPTVLRGPNQLGYFNRFNVAGHYW